MIIHNIYGPMVKRFLILTRFVKQIDGRSNVAKSKSLIWITEPTKTLEAKLQYYKINLI